MRNGECGNFDDNVKRSLKGMRFARKENFGNSCVVDFRNPKVKDYGYGEVGFDILDVYKGGAIALDKGTNLVEGQIPMPHHAIPNRKAMDVLSHCSKEDTMIHGEIGDDVNFAVFIGCRNTKAFWKALKKMSQRILESGSATALTPKQLEEL